MEIDIKNLEKYTLVSLTGSLDLYNVGNLKKKLNILLEENDISYLVIDLKSIEYMDSSGIAMIAHIRKKMMKKEGGKLVLLRANEEILQVMRLAALEQFFTFANSEEEL